MKILTDFRCIYFVVCPHDLLRPYYEPLLWFMIVFWLDRYIFTMLNPLSCAIFNLIDDNLLKYLSDNNICIEPGFYCPVVPMVLVNVLQKVEFATLVGFTTPVCIQCFVLKNVLH